MLIKHQIAPPFSLPDEKNKMHSLSDYEGSYVLLYFYPKDNTPGCTKEACSFRDLWQEIKPHAKIIGISPDTVESHQKFSMKHTLPFPILSDPEKTVIKAYQAWAKKKFLGKEYMGVLRISYLIGPDGTIQKAYPSVKPEIHAKQVLDDLRALKK
jgi:peroxiredoxin Q/BCP